MRALPPVSRDQRCARSTSVPGRSVSVPNVDGAAPRTSTPAAAPAGARITVHPVRPTGSVQCPTRAPSGSLCSSSAKAAIVRKHAASRPAFPRARADRTLPARRSAPACPMPRPQFHHDRGPGGVDVLVIGAGVSGINAGCRLQESCPGKTVAILEARDAIGGTWDLFRFPGIRSDSDMFTLCYPFRPWTGSQAIVDGPAILEYVRDTAREFGMTSGSVSTTGSSAPTGHRPMRAGPSRWSAVTPARRSR